MRSLVVASVVGLAGCWTGSVAEPHSTLEPAPANDKPLFKAKPDGPFPAHTLWRGRYSCSQGDTAVDLTLDLGQGGRVIAIFEFGPLSTNPTVSSGAYRLIGHLDERPEGLSLKLYPDRWLSRPDGYEMVELTAKSDRRRRHMRGTIDHYGCGALELEIVE